MSMCGKLTVHFGVPKHGWLPVSVQSDDFELRFAASDVPVDSLDELCSALILVFQRIEAQVSWHLEPEWYHFRFAFPNDLVALYITEQQGYAAARTEVARLVSSIELVVLPFYRALKSFIPSDNEEDWPAVDSVKLKKLSSLVKEWKANR